MQLVDLGGQNSKFTVVFKITGKTTKKSRKNWNFYAKSVFIFGVILKTITIDTLNVH